MSNSQRIHLGVAYYPEHWTSSRWLEDARLMQAAGISVVRMAEFAWSTLEPETGVFCFDWLDQAIELLARHGILSVLGTPTAAPPAWLVQQHPEILAVDERGQRVQFGNRCHYCVNSPVFHVAARRIVGAMAEHFGPNRNVIGWQIDNEFNRVCYCDHCQELFQRYLAEKYESLAVLNQRWSTSYWSQTYTDWGQIPMPVGPHNPGLMLDLKHFVTRSYRSFQKLQLDELRPHLLQGVWTTHNFMGWYDGYDHYDMSADLDMASWDWYVGSGHNDFRLSGSPHDLTRGFKRKNYWLIETQPGNVNWAQVNSTLDKGEARTMAWQAVAHGADAVSYWQWRSAYNGQEQLHGTLIDPSGQPRPFYSEAQQVGKEFLDLSPLIYGSTPQSNVLMLNSYPSHWAIGWQRHHAEFDYVKHFNHYYRALAARGLNVEILNAHGIADASQLSGYSLVIAPALCILNEDLVRPLITFVEQGGLLVLTLRSGAKDTYNAFLPSRSPGPFAGIAGVEVEDYYALLDPVPVAGEGIEGEAQIWAERLKINGDVQLIARYGKSNGWLDGQAAISKAAFGKGWVYYIGAYLDESAQQQLVDQILTGAGISYMDLPAGVEMRTRTSPDGKEIIFLINHQPEEVSLSLPWPAYDHLRKAPVDGGIVLGRYEVAVLTKGVR